MKFFLSRVCPVVAVLIFIGGLWLWLGGTYFDNADHDKSLIVLRDDPSHPLLQIFGIYFFLKCTF